MKTKIQDTHIHLSNEERGDHLTNRCLTTNIRDRGFYLKGWRDECNLNIEAISNHDVEIFHEGTTIEIDFVLNSKPDKNTFFFQIDSKNLNFYYQPPLTQEEIDEGCFRPDNIIGSYAVYHKDKQDNHKNVNGTEVNYATSKFCHINRPYAEDINGNRVWCKLKVLHNKLAVRIPQEFLDSAEYPVRIDPVFESTTRGASTSVGVSDYQYTNQKTMTAATNQKVDSISVWCRLASGHTANMNTALYKDTGSNAPGVRYADHSTSAQVTTSIIAVTPTLAANPEVTPNTQYWLAHTVDTSNPTVYYDTTAPLNRWAYKNAGGHNFTDPWGSSTGTSATRRYSVYCTYSAGQFTDTTTIFSDATITSASESVTINSDSTIYVTESTTINSDSTIYVTESTTINSNSIIQNTNTSNIYSNSHIWTTESVTINSDSEITPTNIILSDAHIIGHETIIILSNTSIAIKTDGTLTEIIKNSNIATSGINQPDIINISPGIFATVYRGQSGGLQVVTLSILDRGAVISSTIDSLVIDTDTTISYARIIKVYDNVYAVVYSGADFNGKIRTFTINVDGTIGVSVIDTLTPTKYGNPSIISTFAINYFATTYFGLTSNKDFAVLTIDNNGVISNSFISSIDLSNTSYSIIERVSGEIYAAAYNGAFGGVIETYSIDSLGNINGPISSSTNSVSYLSPSLAHITNNLYVLAYFTDSTHGYVSTFTLEADGSIGDFLNTLTFNSVTPTNGYTTCLTGVGNGVFILGYDNNIKTFKVDALGNITGIIDTINTIISNNCAPRIINVEDNIYVGCFGPGSKLYTFGLIDLGTENISSDTSIWRTDAYLKSDTTVFRTFTETILSNTFVKSPGLDSDAVIWDRFTVNIVSDTTIYVSEVVNINSDSLIISRETVNIISDSYIQNTNTSNIYSNSHIWTTESVNINSDSNIYITESTTISSNSDISGKVDINSNSHIWATESTTILSNAWIKVNEVVIYSAATVIIPIEKVKKIPVRVQPNQRTSTLNPTYGKRYGFKIF